MVKLNIQSVNYQNNQIRNNSKTATRNHVGMAQAQDSVSFTAGSLKSMAKNNLAERIKFIRLNLYNKFAYSEDGKIFIEKGFNKDGSVKFRKEFEPSPKVDKRLLRELIFEKDGSWQTKDYVERKIKYFDEDGVCINEAEMN